MLSQALGNRIEAKSILVTDSKNSYVAFAKENSLNLIQIPSGKHKKDGYTINENMFTEVLSLKINLKSNDVYSTQMPFNIEEYKSWYENHT